MIEFLEWWQSIPYRIDPVAFSVFGFPVRYYGLTYILAFLLTYWLLIYRTSNEPRFRIYNGCIQELMMFLALGIFLGGRIGYATFYNFSYYMTNILEVVLPMSISEEGVTFTGFTGMSYHGGLIGSIVAALIFANSRNIDFLKTADLVVPIAPLGYTFGRLGNFVNGELYGRPTSLPIGMYFPSAEIDVLRHPSQLYESVFEGVFIFAIMWALKNRTFMNRLMLGFYLILYGVIRFLIEYLRQPDFHIGLICYSLTMGQILCGFMIIIGLFSIIYITK